MKASIKITDVNLSLVPESLLWCITADQASIVRASVVRAFLWRHHKANHSLVQGRLGHVQFGTIADGAIKNNFVQIFVWAHVFFSLGSIPRTRKPGSYASMFNFLQNDETRSTVKSSQGNL